MPEDQQGYEPPARDPGEPAEQPAELVDADVPTEPVHQTEVLESVPAAPAEQFAGPRVAARHRGNGGNPLANPKLWLGVGAGVLVLVLALIAVFSGDDTAPTAAPSEPPASILPGAPGSTAPPTDEPTDEPTDSPSDLPAPGRTIDTPQEAGGLVRILENELASAVDVSAFEDAGLRSGVVAAYAERDSDEPGVIFTGGTFIQPLPADNLEQAAREGLTAAFGSSALAMVGSDEFGELTEHDAGPLGGYLFCTTVGGAEEGIPACGWVDEWTMGFGLGLVGTEDEMAERLLAMRSDLEKEA